MNDPKDTHWENFKFRKSWLDYSIFVSSFVLSVFKNRVQFLSGFGSRSGSSFQKNASYCLLNPFGLGVTESLINQNVQFYFSWNLLTFHRIYLQLISVRFLRYQIFLHFMKSQFGVTLLFLMKLSFFQHQIFKGKK